MSKRTKNDFILEQIELKQEDIWRMELVRDLNSTRDPKEFPKAPVEMDAANKRIQEITVEILWLKTQLKTKARKSASE